MRLLIIIALIYFGYRAVKSWLTSQVASPKTFPDRSGKTIDDVMVKDPYCEAYFPKRNGLPLTVDGKVLYFCSEECRSRYTDMQTQAKT